MRHLLLILIVAGCFPAIVFGQERKSDKARAVILPSEYVLPVIVAQPDCPLQIEKAMVVKYLPGYINEMYQVRNTGTKQVRHYYLARWYSDGTGYVGGGVMPPDKYLQPGESAGLPTNSVEIVPLTDALKEELKIGGEMKRIAYFMIVEVEFSDGTKYDATSVFNAFKEHISGLSPVYNTRYKF